MTSRRNLKKHVNYISEVTVGMCIIEGMGAEGEKREAIADLVEKTLNMRSDIISRISHTEPGNVKGFYKKLKSDFNAQIEEVFNKLNEK
ncbi:hypothetical protein [Bacteroides caecigallinarum]|uniref:hypothetical protein n=1 Tax=Bacteroides caecigallinarum TaxID=1411144 RepID=UPI00195D61EE|nr:hypothetical protein [Bacteroides caecigallinarum]MBM6882718.1 hypothetical protein [Bacteroides caecigallinarum]MBM6888711.1 hypothetical protein [Bacteroides caecigallinarum]MCF2552421.1 hypothetical protein [Bacteroides caecigallinarum]